MENKSEHDADDQLYAMMRRVISKRKKCPPALLKFEEERIASYLKRCETAKVELDEEVGSKEIKYFNDFIMKNANLLPAESLTAEAETRLLQAKRNIENINLFLQMRSSYEKV